MARADRLLRLVQILRRHRLPVTGAVIAAELDVSLRTIYRDVLELQGNGVPIRGEAGFGYVLGEGYDLPPLMFTADELEALMLGIRFVQGRADAGLARAAEDAAAKIATVIPSELRPVFLDPSGLLPPGPGEPMAERVEMQTVRLAIRKGWRLTFSYRDARGDGSRRTVWPILIGYMQSARILAGWCELRQDFRTFRTDRMSEMEAHGERYPARRHDLMARWKKHMADRDPPRTDTTSAISPD